MSNKMKKLSTIEDLPTLNARRTALVAELAEVSLELSNQSVWGAELPDHAFDQKRSDLLAQRTEIEKELTALKADIKRLNIAKSEMDRVAAEERRAAGQSEHVSNMQRAAKRGNVRPSELERAKEQAAATQPQKRQETRGEAILRMARTLRRIIKTLKQPLPHNAPMKVALEDFIAAQDAHVKEYVAGQKIAQSSCDPQNACAINGWCWTHSTCAKEQS